MRLYSFQSKEFVNRVLNSEETRIDYDTINSSDFTYRHHRTKDIYDGEDFIYCFFPLRRDISEVRELIYNAVFENLSFFSLWYRIDLQNSMLMEFEVPDDVGIIGEVSCDMILTQGEITKLLSLPYEEYCKEAEQYENVLPYIDKNWLIGVYDINSSKYLPYNVYEFTPLVNKGGLFEDTVLLVVDETKAKIKFYEEVTNTRVSRFNRGLGIGFDKFKDTDEYKTFKEYCGVSDENRYKMQNPEYEVQFDKEKYTLRAFGEMIAKHKQGTLKTAV